VKAGCSSRRKRQGRRLPVLAPALASVLEMFPLGALKDGWDWPRGPPLAWAGQFPFKAGGSEGVGAW
jgi:hypothetical protein